MNKWTTRDATTAAHAAGHQIAKAVAQGVRAGTPAIVAAMQDLARQVAAAQQQGESEDSPLQLLRGTGAR